MFIAKIYKEKQLLDVKHYISFQNALANIADKYIFDSVPDELVNTLGNPEIHCFSYSEETGEADDFEFRYPNGVMVYVGEISPVDTGKIKQ